VTMVSLIRLAIVGTASDGGAAGKDDPARWISVQIGQESSLLTGAFAGMPGACRSCRGASGNTVGICAANGTDRAAAERGPKPHACT
jgi:hypothetical protein